jgi:hypothetical protein
MGFFRVQEELLEKEMLLGSVLDLPGFGWIIISISFVEYPTTITYFWSRLVVLSSNGLMHCRDLHRRNIFCLLLVSLCITAEDQGRERERERVAFQVMAISCSVVEFYFEKI